jgi:mycothiol synthase
VTLLKIRPFRKGIDEEVYVKIFSVAFSDYDDMRSVTLQEVKTLENAPSYNLEGLLIAEWNGRPAGMVQALVDKFREEKKGFIQSLAVLPEFRRKEIAKRLVSEAISSLKMRGMKTVGAWAQTDRLACVHIYESSGFKCVRTSSLMKGSLNEIPNVEVNNGISLREAQLEDDQDLALVNMLDNESFKEHFNHRPVTIEETRYMLLEMPWWKHQKAWFAILKKQPIGYVVTGIDVGLNREKNVKYGWVLDIGVLKPYRRQKIGATLILRAMQYLKTQGMEEALLYVDDQNPTHAIRLYEKVGFKVYHKSAIYELQLV